VLCQLVQGRTRCVELFLIAPVDCPDFFIVGNRFQGYVRDTLEYESLANIILWAGRGARRYAGNLSFLLDAVG